MFDRCKAFILDVKWSRYGVRCTYNEFRRSTLFSVGEKAREFDADDSRARVVDADAT